MSTPTHSTRTEAAAAAPAIDRHAAHAARHAGLIALLAAAGVLVAASAAGCRAADAGTHAGTAPGSPYAAAADERPLSREELVTRGEYLVMVGGCHDCHTPWKMGPNGPEQDMERALSGHPEQLVITEAPPTGPGPWIVASAATNTAHAGPWGVSFTANLTPDENTGIGIWTEEMFIQTLRTGRHWGQSRPILPPMPWFNYGKMSEQDLKAIYAYLRTVKPIHNRVPQPLPPAGAAEPDVFAAAG